MVRFTICLVRLTWELSYDYCYAFQQASSNFACGHRAALGLQAGDKLVAELIGDHIVLLPQPESWVDYFVGSMKGVYGSTREEIDRYIAEVRYGWDIDALKDALALDTELRAVYMKLRRLMKPIA